MYNIVHISDLHFSEANPLRWYNLFDKYLRLFSLNQDYYNNKCPELNAKKVFEKVSLLRPDHIIITGDLTRIGKKEEFKKAKSCLLELQASINTGRPYNHKNTTNDSTREDFLPNNGPLDPDLFTIIPGNHDVVFKGRKGGRYSKLGLFMTYFGETIGKCNKNDFRKPHELFPVIKELDKDILIIGINSNRNISVLLPFWNAKGKIDKNQLKKFSESINSSKVVIVALHHHVLPLPYHPEGTLPLATPDVAESSLILKNAAQFLRICFEFKVNLILHGHKHKSFLWENNPKVTRLDPYRQIAVLAADSCTFKGTDYKRCFYLLKKEQDTNNEIYFRLISYQWDDEKEAFEDKPGPFIGRKDIIKLLDERPYVLGEIAYYEEYHRTIRVNGSNLWRYYKDYNEVKFLEYITTLYIKQDYSLLVRKTVTLSGLKGGSPVALVRESINGQPGADFKDVNPKLTNHNLSIRSVYNINEETKVAYIPCIDDPNSKGLLIFFLPEIKTDEDYRRYEIEWRWPQFWNLLNTKNEMPITEKPISKEKIGKLVIRIVVEKGFIDINCEKHILEGDLVPGTDKKGNTYWKFEIENAIPTNYELIVKRIT